MAGQKKTNRLKPENTLRSDIVIIGGGLAGLYTALKLAPRPVTIVMSAALGEGTASHLAQGGIATAIGQDDSAKKHQEDTIKAGAGLVDAKISCLTAQEASNHIETLLAYGVPFDQDEEGELKLTREAAHSKKRIVHVKGDGAGKAIMAVLIEKVRETPSIKIIEHAVAREFKTRGQEVSGVYLWPNEAQNLNSQTSKQPSLLLKTKAVILASGGIGGLFSKTTNPLGANGEALAMAARAGAVIADAEFVQFHPTAIDAGKDPVPLATEALRGEGAVLVNSLGERFMLPLHPDAELAPRDIVARAVFAEIQDGRGAFLDCRTTIGEKFKDHFPSVYQHCQDMGIDPAVDLIPVAPAVHYHMGGVFTDAVGRTTLNGLWACGEAASTGLHGANRLASNSLLEAMVFADRAASDIANMFIYHDFYSDVMPHSLLPEHNRIISGKSANDNACASLTVPLKKQSKLQRKAAHELNIIGQIRSLMYKAAGLQRNATDLAAALQELTFIKERNAENRVIRNMVCAGQFILVSAYQREESRGGHFRSDFPYPRQALSKRSFMTLAKMEKACDFILKQHFADDQLASTKVPLKLVVNR